MTDHFGALCIKELNKAFLNQLNNISIQTADDKDSRSFLQQLRWLLLMSIDNALRLTYVLHILEDSKLLGNTKTVLFIYKKEI